MDQASTIGLDIAKRVFQAHGADATGRVRWSPDFRQEAKLGPPWGGLP